MKVSDEKNQTVEKNPEMVLSHKDKGLEKEEPQNESEDLVLEEEDKRVHTDHDRLSEIQGQLSAEKERVKRERREKGLKGRSKKSDLWRELEAEEKTLKKKILGGTIQIDEERGETEYAAIDSLNVKTIVEAVDSFLQFSLAQQHPDPESLPFSRQEKKMIQEPLERVLSQAGAEMSPGTALIIACSTVILPRVAPVVLPRIIEMINRIRK